MKLKNVSFKYGFGKKKEDNLSDISLHIKAGECVVITGESGCGKTTLTRVLNGLCPNYFEGLISGTYILNGELVFSSGEGKTIDIDSDYEKSLDDIGLLAGNVFQDPRSQFFSINTTDEIVLAMENRNFTREFQVGGASLEKNYRDNRKQFVQIELLAVRKEYQGKGFMRPLVETAFETAKKAKLPVIVSTDAKLKKDKYEHIGMKHVNTRMLGEKSFMYDLVREA
ncbi:MAG: GNAT family N-acetyltransferase [Lachnospiraceae bacterium]|nr:GNAT family N-acetyltransferase [Lachnospiraceae bacterium]